MAGLKSATLYSACDMLQLHRGRRLRNLGLDVRVKDDGGDEKYSNVLFSAPPSGSADYPAEVHSLMPNTLKNTT
jgi:hypothetical protein